MTVDWVHSFKVIHSSRHCDSHSPIHSESLSGQIKCCELSHSHQLINRDNYSYSSIHHTVIPTKPAEAGNESMTPEQTANRSNTCATEAPTRSWWEFIIDLTSHSVDPKEPTGQTALLVVIKHRSAVVMLFSPCNLFTCLLHRTTRTPTRTSSEVILNLTIWWRNNIVIWCHI